MKLNLPKEYLSYSQCRLWLDNKNQYRERYFEMKEQRASKYMIFGSEIAKGLEDKSINIPLLPVYPVSEYQIKLEVEGVPFYAYIDSYWPEKFKFREYKTGTWKQNGIPRWTQREVDNHMQLDVYSLLIKEKNGEVDDECHLDWIHTQPKIKKLEFDGHVLISNSNGIELTGDVTSFTRVITQTERDRMKILIRSIAEEISVEYTDYKKLRDFIH